MNVTPLEQGIVQVKSTQMINHPKANLLTIQIGHDAHCNFPLSVELALSNGYRFLTDVIPDFAPYAVLLDDSNTLLYYNMRSETRDGYVMTYQNVPLTALAKFLNLYAPRN